VRVRHRSRRRVGLVTRRFWLQTQGQDLVEYALLAGFVALSASASMPRVGRLVRRIFRRVSRVLAGATRSGTPSPVPTT